MTAPSIARRGVCLVIAAPSGGGKSSLARALIAQDPATSLSVSVTTRPPRPGETEGVDYYFRHQDRFSHLMQTGGLLEHATVFGRSYGTPREPVERTIAAGRDMVFDIDWQGHRQMRAAIPGDVVGVFLLPPSMAALETRLRARNDSDPGEIDRRMALARGEMSHAAEFDHVVVNETFEETLGRVRSILAAARCRPGRLTGLDLYVAAL